MMAPTVNLINILQSVAPDEQLRLCDTPRSARLGPVHASNFHQSDRRQCNISPEGGEK